MSNNKDFEFKINSNTSFPSQLDSFDNKIKEGWGLGVARAIESEWFYRTSGSNCKFYTQREDIIERRLYAKGLQNMSKYKKQLGTNGDLSHLNLSSKPITLIPKLVNIICNGMTNRDYSVRAFSIDPTSKDNRVSYRTKIENDMLAKDMLKKAKETLNVDVASMPVEELPESKEELDIHMQLEYKQAIELSEELAIETVFQENRWDDHIKARVLKDIIVTGTGWVKNRFVKDKGIVVEYVDIENKVQSESDCPYYSDCFYHGELKTVLISDVLTEYPWINDYPEAKKQLENASNNWWNYHNTPKDDRIKGTTNLLFFTYTTTRERAKKIKEKSTGERILSKASDTFDESKLKKGQTNDFKRTSVVEEVLFEGVYVPGTEILLKWEVSEHMSRPKSNKQKVIQQFIGVSPDKEKGYIDSCVARMMPIDDKIQVLELKAQQIIQRMMPNGYEIDVDAIVELDLGDGAKYTQQGVIDMFFETGTILTRSMNSGGDYNYAKKSIQELKHDGSINQLRALREEREQYTNLLREVIGLNKASDASTPEKDSLVGLQKLAALNTNTATRHILDGTIDVTKRTAEAITYRVADLLKFSDLKEDFVRKVGTNSVEDLEYVKNLHLHDFAIFLDLSPDEEEKAKLESDLTKEIDKGALGVEDKYKILNIKNLKLAVSYLAILKSKRQKKQEEQKMREIEAQTQGNIKSAQVAEQAKQQTAQLEAMVKSELQKLIDEGAIQKEVARGEQDRLTEQLKGELKERLQYVINSGQSQKIQEQEDAKKERLLKQGTITSEENYKKQNNGQPIDFEQKENQIEAFNTSTIN
jgi:hypothetical protein